MKKSIVLAAVLAVGCRSTRDDRAEFRLGPPVGAHVPDSSLEEGRRDVDWRKVATRAVHAAIVVAANAAMDRR